MKRRCKKREEIKIRIKKMKERMDYVPETDPNDDYPR